MKMIKIFIKITLCVVALFTFLSCSNNNNYGWPGKVTFSKEGGIIKCSGDQGFHHVEVLNYDGDGEFGPKFEGDTIRDSIIVIYQWLTIKCKYMGGSAGGDQMTLICEPNNTGKMRSLYIYGSVIDEDAMIKVVQNK